MKVKLRQLSEKKQQIVEKFKITDIRTSLANKRATYLCGDKSGLRFFRSIVFRVCTEDKFTENGI